MPRQPRQLAGLGADDLKTQAAIDAYAGPPREVIVGTETLHIQDGTTPGGIRVVTDAPAVRLFDTRDAAAASSVPARVTSIRTSGRTAANDGHGGDYVRVDTLPAGADGFTMINGSKWLRKFPDRMSVTGQFAINPDPALDPVGYETGLLVVGIPYADNVITIRSPTSGTNGQAAMRYQNPQGHERCANGYGNEAYDFRYGGAWFVEGTALSANPQYPAPSIRLLMGWDQADYSQYNDAIGPVGNRFWTPFEIHRTGKISLRRRPPTEGVNNGACAFRMAPDGNIALGANIFDNDIVQNYRFEVRNGGLWTDDGYYLGTGHRLFAAGTKAVGLSIANDQGVRTDHLQFRVDTNVPGIDGAGGELQTSVGQGAIRTTHHTSIGVGVMRSNPEVALDVAGALRIGGYTTGTLPAGIVGAIIKVNDARDVGEPAGGGLGTFATYKGGRWVRLADNTPLTV